VTSQQQAPAESVTQSQRVQGSASTALYGLINSDRTEAIVLGVSDDTVWMSAEERTVAVTTKDSTRWPIAAHLHTTADIGVGLAIFPTDRAQIGNGRIMFEDLTVEITGWWDPRPVLAATTLNEIAERIAELPAEVPGISSEPLGTALASRSAGGILHAARFLLGKGPGLTPDGDDLLTGALAATRLLGEAVGHERTIAMIAGISTPMAQLAEARTTTLSAALVQSALRGQVGRPAGELLKALSGTGSIAAAHLGLFRSSHTSGPALAAGIVLGARALTIAARW